jgi:hypothetical protein
LAATVEQLRIVDDVSRRPSEVSWRIDIWTEVIEEWNASWTNRVFGIGFGNEIEAMTVPGRQGYDGLNRGVHSIIFTTLARQGLAGVAVGMSLLGVLLLTAPPLSRTIVAPVILSGLTVGLFDVFLEGVHAPVFLWLTVGLGLSQRH